MTQDGKAAGSASVHGARLAAFAVLLAGATAGCGRLGYDVQVDPPSADAAAGDRPSEVDASSPDRSAFEAAPEAPPFDALLPDTPAPDTQDAPAPDRPDAPVTDLPADRVSDVSVACTVLAGTYNPANGHCYLTSQRPSDTWLDADTWCRVLGFHLVTITSAAEQAFVLALRQAGGADLWIGLVQTGTGPFQWVTGEPLAYQAWAPGNPDNGRDARGLFTANGWRDAAPGERHGALCEF